MQAEEIKRSLNQVCGSSSVLRRGLFRTMDWLTVRSWHLRREIRKWFKNAPVHAHILDAGSGFGHNAYWISTLDEHHSVLAIDASAEQVSIGNRFARSNKRTNLLFKTGDLNELNEAEAFDLIVCTETLDKICHPSQVIHNFHQALRNDGLVIATVNRSDQPEADCHEHTPSSGFDMADLKELFKEAGFCKVKAHYTGGKAGQTARTLSIAFPIRLLRLSRLFAILLPIYYLLVAPISIILNWIDSHTAQSSGRGILLLARKGQCT